MGSDKFKYIIGIDPDVDRNGIAIIDPKDKSIQLLSYSISDFCDLSITPSEYVVILEASWLIKKSNFHPMFAKMPMTKAEHMQQLSIASKIGQKVGRNHQVGLDIKNILENMELELIEQKPLKKIWAGKDKKISKKEFDILTESQGFTVRLERGIRQNQEMRDAGLLALNYYNQNYGK